MELSGLNLTEAELETLTNNGIGTFTKGAQSKQNLPPPLKSTLKKIKNKFCIYWKRALRRQKAVSNFLFTRFGSYGCSMLKSIDVLVKDKIWNIEKVVFWNCLDCKKFFYLKIYFFSDFHFKINNYWMLRIKNVLKNMKKKSFSASKFYSSKTV